MTESDVSKLLEQAVEAVRALPPADQKEVAQAMLALADVESEPISPNHVDAVIEGLAQARRGERATPEEVKAAFRRFEG